MKLWSRLIRSFRLEVVAVAVVGRVVKWRVGFKFFTVFALQQSRIEGCSLIAIGTVTCHTAKQ